MISLTARAAAIRVLAVIAGIVGPLTLFELAQPGHSVNKYYLELHQSWGLVGQPASLSGSVASRKTISELDVAPTIVIPTAVIVGNVPR